MQTEQATKPFSDEEFLDFTEALSDIFADNYIDGRQLWGWWNYGGSMKAFRYAFEPDEHSPRFSMRDGDVAFAIDAYRNAHKEGETFYELVFGNPGFKSRFDSLESLVGAIVGIAKSLKLSASKVGS